MKSRIFIPPYWADILFTIAILAISQWDWLFTRSTGFQYHEQRFFLISGIYLLITKTISYVVCPKGIIIFWLLIPVRLIKWERVSTAEYIYKWNNKVIDIKGQGIVITFYGCPMFSVEVDSPSWFVLRHPLSSCFIRFAPRHRRRYVEVFKKYYPDLSFQLGCDTSWLKPMDYEHEN